MSAYILLVEDDADFSALAAETLRGHGFEVTTCKSAEEGLALATERPFDVVLTDQKLPRMSGTEFCLQLLKASPDVPVIIMTGHGALDSAIDALRNGAQDYLLKPVDLQAVALTVERAVKHGRLRDEVRRLRHELAEIHGGDELLGDSPAIEAVRQQIRRVARTEATILITGESGSGKELIARSLHQHSTRADGPFVAVNCGAIPENLFESEVFGHARGAFTGAHRASAGLIRAANRGTLFLDEVGELPLPLQTKLLRVLQDRRVRAVGSPEEAPVDIRVVAATNRDLSALVASGAFRADLFFRLNVVRIEAPPLRARGRDVLLIAQSFVKRYAQQMGKHVVGIASPTAARMLTYRWPGNIRELQNCVERAVALTDFDHLTPRDLPSTLGEPPGPTTGTPLEGLPSLDEVTFGYVHDVLRIADGNRSTAAKVLGVDRRTLQRMLAGVKAGQATAADDES